MSDRFPMAKALLQGSLQYPYLHGEVTFTDSLHDIKVKGMLSCLPPNGSGFYGFHLHKGGSCMPVGGPDAFGSAGPHYNPGNQPHPLHAGDFPVIMASGDGFARFSFVTDRFSIDEIIGRVLIVHMNPDDYRTPPSGSSGKRIACGIITRL